MPEGLWAAKPAWTNFTDNAVMVQFTHRISAYLLWGAVLLHAIWMGRTEKGTTHARRGWVLFVLVTLQAAIGITTLILQVPMTWALLHQFGGLVVLAFAVAHWRALRPHESNIGSTARTNKALPSATVAH